MPVLNDDDSGKVSVGNAAKSEKSGRQGSRTDERVIDRVAELLVENPRRRSPEIHSLLLADQGLHGLVPEARTVRSLVAAARERLDDTRWSPKDLPDEDAAIVLQVLERVREYFEQMDAKDPEHHLAERLTRHHLPISQRHAHWIARLQRWMPDLGPWLTVSLAIDYMDRVERGAPTHDLDESIAHWGMRKELKRTEANK